MNPAAIAHARKVASQVRAAKVERAWRESPIADLSRVQPVNRPRRILRPIY